MKLTITLPLGNKTLEFTAQRISASPAAEKFRIMAKGGNKAIILRNNRPALTALHSRSAIKWQLIEGDIKSTEFITLLISKLEVCLKEQLPVLSLKEPKLF